MRLSSLLTVTALSLSAPALADSRVFIVANQPDGYGIDQCLANGERCGAPAARSYCQSREFAEAKAYRRIDPDEITGALPQKVSGQNSASAEYVAITCER